MLENFFNLPINQLTPAMWLAALEALTAEQRAELLKTIKEVSK